MPLSAFALPPSFVMSAPWHLAYVFERFPSFTQTFCVREILELERQGLRPLLFSIRDTRDEAIKHFPPELLARVRFLPPRDELIAQVRRWKDDHSLPRAAALTLRHWTDQPDKARVYEAAWIARQLADLGPAAPHHVHSHFAGIGARTCWWLRQFSGVTTSFTAHANDIFCQPEPQSPAFERLFHDAAFVITVSDFTADQLRQQYPTDAHRIHRVYNGLDLQPLIDARAKADRSRALGGILSVGRLIEKKGYPDLITACALLRDQGLFFHCRIVGEGPLEETLRQQISALHLQNQVQLIGPLGMDEIIRLLTEETQIFALACATEADGGKDNLPTVLMEAMAASLPCVSTRLAGVPEMVIPEQTGYLAEEGQPAAFATHLATLLQDPALCVTLGRAGLAHAQAHFAQSNTSRALLTAFATHGDLRLTADLIARHPWLRPLSFRRLLKKISTPQLRHRMPKVSSKNFDLPSFLKG
jgi:colanic acid/amylovoran biosynthesis glycosyltransferase